VSIVFGIRKPSGAVATRQELSRLASATARYATDGVSVAAQGQIGMGVQPYHTHERSYLESQPLVDSHGNMLVLDGRIDNHVELSDLLNIRKSSSPDSLLVLAAFQRWGEECFSRLIGDWSLAIWANIDRTLYLARDHAGTRTLYFEIKDETILWSTSLETFFVQCGTREIDEHFAACYLACLPIRDLTPYKGIKAVSPAHYVKLRDGVSTHKAHWNWLAKDTIRYRTDSEYDQHFLSLLRQSVDRRTGPGAPILAQLSGGMDSSSIVCISDDQRISQGAAPEDLLDTISFYDDSEPDWNERPYFSAAEAKRGKAGIHVDSSIFELTLTPPDGSAGDQFLPGRDSSAIQSEEAFETILRGRGYRVILSGIGGDEILGGVPNPLPELADLLIAGNFSSLLTRGIAWSLPDRKPLIHTLFKTVSHLSQLYFRAHRSRRSFAPWIGNSLKRLCDEALCNDVTQFSRFGQRPSRIDSGLAWWSVMETLPHINPGFIARYEYRYPYLDRDLVDFLFTVPTEQLLQPGRRRLLMRRALAGIVPDVILERRRKAFLSRNLIKVLDSTHAKLVSLTSQPGFAADWDLDCDKITRALKSVVDKREGQWAHALLRTALFALWLNSTTTLLRMVENSGSSSEQSLLAR
jgi:asparagine synthase (glutamine-hydrolysing)